MHPVNTTVQLANMALGKEPFHAQNGRASVQKALKQGGLRCKSSRRKERPGETTDWVHMDYKTSMVKVKDGATMEKALTRGRRRVGVTCKKS